MDASAVHQVSELDKTYGRWMLSSIETDNRLITGRFSSYGYPNMEIVYFNKPEFV